MIDIDELPPECPVFRIVDSQYHLACQNGDLVEGTLVEQETTKETVLAFYPVSAEYLGEDPYMAVSGGRHKNGLSQTALLEPLTQAAEDMLMTVLSS